MTSSFVYSFIFKDEQYCDANNPKQSPRDLCIASFCTTLMYRICDMD